MVDSSVATPAKSGRGMPSSSAGLRQRDSEIGNNPSPTITRRAGTTSQSQSENQKIFVLSADGSKLFLLDPSSPPVSEDPPAYHTINSPQSAHRSVTGDAASYRSHRNDDEDDTNDARSGIGNERGNGEWDEGEAGPSSPRAGARTTSLRSFHIRDLPTLDSSASVLLPHRGSSVSLDQDRSRVPYTSRRNRRYEPVESPRIPNDDLGSSGGSGGNRANNSLGNSARRNTISTPARSRPVMHHSYTTPPGTTPLSHQGGAYQHEGDAVENYPLSGQEIPGRSRRGTLRSILCGELGQEGDDEITWRAGWRRFWRPVGKRENWRCLLHLLILNFPLALLVWPFLVVGTVAGTALLITLPLGAAVWWLTLILARSAARLEIILQTHHHPLPLTDPFLHEPTQRQAEAIYHPIFHRIIATPERSPLLSPRSRSSTVHSPVVHDTPAGRTGPASDRLSQVLDSPGVEAARHVEWDTRFIKCSYEMFCDHYSYSALTYFLLIKPITTLFPTIILAALFPLSVVTIIGLPVYLRAARRWGVWQARVATNNLEG